MINSCILVQDHHNEGECGHFASQTLAAQQSFEAGADGALQFAFQLHRRSAGRDRAHLWIGQNSSGEWKRCRNSLREENKAKLIFISIVAGRPGLRYDQPPVSVGQNLTGSVDSLSEDFLSKSKCHFFFPFIVHVEDEPSVKTNWQWSFAGATETHQVSGQVAKPQPQRPDGGGGKAGAVPTRDVWYNPGWEPAGRRLRAHSRLPRSLLEGNPSTDQDATSTSCATSSGDGQHVSHVTTTPPGSPRPIGSRTECRLSARYISTTQTNNKKRQIPSALSSFANPPPFSYFLCTVVEE